MWNDLWATAVTWLQRYSLLLPPGKGSLILILGGLSMLAFALTLSLVSRSGPPRGAMHGGASTKAPGASRMHDAWFARLERVAQQAGVKGLELASVEPKRSIVRVAQCLSCDGHRPGRNGCEAERSALEHAARRLGRGARVKEVLCTRGARGSCLFSVRRGRLRRRFREPAAGGRVRTMVGAFAGGLCGFFTYWIGAAVLAAQALAQAPVSSLPYEFMRPANTITAWEGILVLFGATLGAAVGRYRWRIAGLLSFIALLSMTLGFLTYSLTVSIPNVPSHQRWISYALLGAEAAGLTLVLIFSFYSLDAATRRRWDRVPKERPFDPSFQPKVALEVPVFNEPPDMVEQTIAHLMRQDYPSDRFLVVVADDSTDQEVRTRLEAYCAKVGAVYVRRPDRRGFKAGAINYATDHLPADVELVSIIDADYWVSPDFLKSIVGYFVDPAIGFVQTPQDYRNRNESFLTRQYQRAEAYFYHAIMPSRNEENAIIFCGTMGVIRRKAMESVGGFGEDQICEDAEISVRLVAAGWNSLYVDRSFGKGLMPAVFEAYKKQFHRWAFGNVRILFTHTGTILRSPMKRRQKLDYLASNIHWFDGYFVLTIAFVLLYLGLGPLLGYDAVSHHQREIALLALVPVFLLVDSVVRLHMVLRSAGHRRLKDAFLVQGMWFAIKFANLSAVTKCMLGAKSPFVRTPKDPGGRLGRFRSFFRAARMTKFESVMGVALMSVAGLNLHNGDFTNPAGVLLPFWLGMYGLFFLCAPIYAYLSYRTLRPMKFRGLPLDAPGLTRPPRPKGGRGRPLVEFPTRQG